MVKHRASFKGEYWISWPLVQNEGISWPRVMTQLGERVGRSRHQPYSAPFDCILRAGSHPSKYQATGYANK